MTLQRFISYSLIIHLLLLFFLFVTPVKKEQRGEPFYARLVSPEDMGLDTEEMPALRGSEKPKVMPLPPETKDTAETQSSSQSSTTAAQEESPHVSQGSKDSKQVEDSQPFILPGSGGMSFPLKKENLFDKDIIAKSAEKEMPQKEKSSVTFDAKEFQYYGYMKRLKEKIEGIWKYPSEAAMQGIYGDLYINFTIKRNGTLGSVELLRTSGHKNLDDAAMKALKEAAPYWPLPEDWKKDSITITGHFIYSLYGVYVR